MSLFFLSLTVLSAQPLVLHPVLPQGETGGGRSPQLQGGAIRGGTSERESRGLVSPAAFKHKYRFLLILLKIKAAPNFL